MKQKIILFLITLVFLAASGFKEHADKIQNGFKSVKIGNQIWMTENWNVQMPKSWYYDNDSIKNKNFGRLYFYSNAIAAAPRGWHLPSLQEWNELISNLGGDSVAATIMLKGGSSGLMLDLAGYKSANNSPVDMFGKMGLTGFYWTSTEQADQTAWGICIEKNNPVVIKNYYRKANGFAVRYIKDGE